MKLTIENIFDFVEEYSGRNGLQDNSDIQKELGVYGDDWHEMIEKFTIKFNVDMTSYLWYFHNGEEGMGIGRLFFKSPYDRVNRIAITPNDLLRIATKQKWDIEYPEHKLPKRRYDLIIGTVVLIAMIGLCVIFGCNQSNQIKQSKLGIEKTEKEFDSISNILLCDSVYPGKNIRIEYLEHEFENNELTATFAIIKNGKSLIFDSLSTRVFAIKFSDFNGDGIKDVLAHNSSDARSNWTWYLYIASSDLNSFKRIKGFEQIKNPNYLKKYDLIDCIVMSGNDWTSFYAIDNDTIIDFGFTVNMGFNNEKQKYYDYDKDYNSALKKVVEMKKSLNN
jgi:hypothetical protein